MGSASTHSAAGLSYQSFHSAEAAASAAGDASGRSLAAPDLVKASGAAAPARRLLKRNSRRLVRFFISVLGRAVQVSTSRCKREGRSSETHITLGRHTLPLAAG